MATPKDRKSEQQVFDVAPAGFDMRYYSLALEIKKFLQGVVDEGTSVDSGTDGGSADLWFTVGGEKLFLNIRPQIQSE